MFPHYNLVMMMQATISRYIHGLRGILSQDVNPCHDGCLNVPCRRCGVCLKAVAPSFGYDGGVERVSCFFPVAYAFGNNLRNCVLFALLMLVTVCFADGKADDCRRDSMFVEQVLAEADGRDGRGCLPLFFARKFIGVPYVAHTLEVNDSECLVVNTSELDCTTLVENVVALTLCVAEGRLSFDGYKDMLTLIRYRQGVLDGYPSRLHYFSDWILDNSAKGIVSEVQAPSPPFVASQTLDLNYMSSHVGSYKALGENPEYIPMIAGQEKALSGKEFKYIPKADVDNSDLLRGVIKDGDIIAIVSGKRGLDIAHLGFAVWQADGLHMLNASMIHKRVVEEPLTLYDYLQGHPSHLGIRLVRIKE